MALVRKVGVLGAGVMGSGIAAHVAGAGIPVLLLDVVPPGLGPAEIKDRAARNRFAQAGKDKLLKARPEAFFSPRDADLIEVGNFEDDLNRLAECDWIVEAVKEDLEVKRALFERIEPIRARDAFVSSNTSGLPLAQLTEGRSADFRQNFLVTHFFNPVRHMRLLELVVSPQTDPRVVARIHKFGDEVLGKGIVYAKDTPNFIANRIGVFAVMDALRLMVELGLSVPEVDAIHGRPLGRPKSAVFRTADIVGLDTLLHVADNCRTLLTRDEDREAFEPPPFVREMVRRGMLGDKSGGGFYKKTQEGIAALDWKTLEYRPQEKVRFDSLGALKDLEDPGERIRALCAADDRAAQYAWKTLSRTLNYSAKRLGEIADDVVNIDRGMRWGFNWDLGPFEVLDALGPRQVAERMARDGLKPAAPIVAMARGGGRFYPSSSTYFDLRVEKEKPVPHSPRALSLPKDEPRRRVLSNESASLWDLGDGVFGLEFHTKMNAIDHDTIAMMKAAVDHAEKQGVALVIGNEAREAFSAGANLMLVLTAAREGQWSQIDSIARGFQEANMRLRYSDVPVVAAPFGLALGGGCELSLGADAIRAHAELYMGLVEVGVGVIPAGGGSKELLFRSMANLPDTVDPFLGAQRAFETIALARVSTSAERARELLFLDRTDGVSLSRESLLRDAKETALGLARAGYRRPLPRTVRVSGESGFANLTVALWSMRKSNQISDHDLKVGTHLARVLTGGSVAAGSRVTEQYLLDLEREAFVSLCGEEKTQARMEHMLLQGKPLRN